MNEDLAKTKLVSHFTFHGNKFEFSYEQVSIQDISGKDTIKFRLGIRAFDPIAVFPGNILFTLETINGGERAVHGETSKSFYKPEPGMLGSSGMYLSKPASKEDVFRVKLWLASTFADFSVKSASSEPPTSLLDDLTTAQQSETPVNGIEVDALEMLDEWFKRTDIKKLNGPSSSIFHDLERVYLAAEYYEITPLCEYIKDYLIHLMNDRNFGEIYQIGNRIGSSKLENAAHQALDSNPEYRNNLSQLERVSYRFFNSIDEICLCMEFEG